MLGRIFEGLNDKQTEAVKIVDGPVLVISGPGSGKTRCLTHRIAYLISQNIPPESILAVTFTNKAAQEMRERVGSLLGLEIPPQNMRYRAKDLRLPQMGTFHSIGLTILRNEILQLGYRRSFTVFDEDDQLSLLKKVLSELEIDSKSFNPRPMLYKISELKTKLISPDDPQPKDYYSEVLSRVYKKYQQELKNLNAVDFDDLIVLPIRIFNQNQETLSKYQEQWRYVLVDEYQDTSYDQYIFINLLAKKYKNLFCIGDDAQSIYQFRRADIRNILNFQKDYPEAKIVMLEQNYRSTKNIITAAQEIISKNKNQLPKSLWTDNDHGEKITIAETINERHEANYVISKIRDYLEDNYKLKDCAILYRTHAQSRALEEALIMSGFSYQIIGGLKFYDRKEIKDLIAYLKLIVNPADFIALERIYNIPARGIGPALLSKITKNNEVSNLNILEATKSYAKENDLSPKQSKTIFDFHKTLADITKTGETKNLKDTIRYIIKRINYEDYIKEFSLTKQKDYENLEDRIENLKELQTVASKYDSMSGKEGIEKFLEEVALLQHTDRLRNDNDRVTLMTIHASKGLEFPAVFIVGMEEGLFPHSRTLVNPSEMEEERRLCYVAVTRAKSYLTLTYAKFRRIFGSASATLPSRFIGEIPRELADYQLLDLAYDEDEEKIFY